MHAYRSNHDKFLDSYICFTFEGSWYYVQDKKLWAINNNTTFCKFFQMCSKLSQCICLLYPLTNGLLKNPPGGFLKCYYALDSALFDVKYSFTKLIPSSFLELPDYLLYFFGYFTVFLFLFSVMYFCLLCEMVWWINAELWDIVPIMMENNNFQFQ